MHVYAILCTTGPFDNPLRTFYSLFFLGAGAPRYIYPDGQCCESAGFSSVYKMNRLNKSLSINVFQLRGMAFLPNNAKPDIHEESDAKTYSHGETV
jgi:hypothetical protein